MQRNTSRSAQLHADSLTCGRGCVWQRVDTGRGGRGSVELVYTSLGIGSFRVLKKSDRARACARVMSRLPSIGSTHPTVWRTFVIRTFSLQWAIRRRSLCEIQSTCELAQMYTGTRYNGVGQPCISVLLTSLPFIYSLWRLRSSSHVLCPCIIP